MNTTRPTAPGLRFGNWLETGSEQPLSRLQKLIISACTPSFSGPDVGLYLEIATMINEKKLNAPREAAMTIVNRINSSNPDVGRHALMLLDICVKNCGYPFHLQISSREFLNELVKRFPENPPSRKSERMLAILEQIELWHTTLCRTSRYKDDLGFIRDMRSLLYRKGYTFPRPKEEDVAVLRQTDTVRTADEIEQEDRLAQEAKLQELIRRGTPRDLKEANKLMKVLAGYDQRNRTDYRAKAAEEVAKVQEKARLLEEMIELRMQGDSSAEGDVYEELANALISAHIKIKKMCEEENEDTEAVEKLLAINDSINRTIKRYNLLQKGDITSATEIQPGTLGTSGPGVSRGAGDDLLLIDFDEALATTDPGPEIASSQATVLRENPNWNDAGPSDGGSMSLMDDLMSLSIGNSSTSLGPLNLGSGPTLTKAQPPKTTLSAVYNSEGRPSSQELLSGLSDSTTPIKTPLFFSGLNPASGQHKIQTGETKRSVDPFQSLVMPSSGSRQVSANSTGNTGSLLDISDPTTTTAVPTVAAGTPPLAAPAVDDDWEFESALPEAQTKTTLEVSQPSDSLRISWAIERIEGDPEAVRILSTVQSQVGRAVQNVVVEVATSKAYKLELKPQSGTNIVTPSEKITQEIIVRNVPAGQAGSVQVRWRARCKVAGREEEAKAMGVLPGLGIE